MERKLILNNRQIEITVKRLCHELLEHHRNLDNTVFLAMQPRGGHVALRLCQHLQQMVNKEIELGYIDSTFHRDDFRRRPMPLVPNATKIPFVLERKHVILIDDVLYTGRSTRAALDAMIAYGRPNTVELMVLINRKYTRELPIEATYVGHFVDTVKSQRVVAEWETAGDQQNNIWLVTQPQPPIDAP